MDNNQMIYEAKDGAYLQLRVTSAPKGATVKEWSGQLDKWMRETFTPDSYEPIGSYTMDVSGETAEVNEFRYNFGDGWQTEFDVLLQKTVIAIMQSIRSLRSRQRTVNGLRVS